MQASLILPLLNKRKGAFAGADTGPVMSDSYAGDLSPREAWELLERERDAALIDVRTQAEWVFVGRADLSALGKSVSLLPWLEFPSGQLNPSFADQIEAAGFAKDQPLLFICRSGQRSQHAAIALTRLGYSRCYNVAEGFEGDYDAERHRGVVGGWKVAGLSWIQD